MLTTIPRVPRHPTAPLAFDHRETDYLRGVEPISVINYLNQAYEPNLHVFYFLFCSLILHCKVNLIFLRPILVKSLACERHYLVAARLEYMKREGS